MERHELWLYKAEGDLALAIEALAIPNEKIRDAAIYHTQQAAEKALKVFLVFKREPLLRTHDLEDLLWICMKHDISFNYLFRFAAQLNPLIMEYRYPLEDFDEPQTPLPEELREAIEAATEVFKFVVDMIATDSVSSKK